MNKSAFILSEDQNGKLSKRSSIPVCYITIQNFFIFPMMYALFNDHSITG